jgi:hypothetical protein
MADPALGTHHPCIEQLDCRIDQVKGQPLLLEIVIAIHV